MSYGNYSYAEKPFGSDETPAPPGQDAEAPVSSVTSTTELGTVAAEASSDASISLLGNTVQATVELDSISVRIPNNVNITGLELTSSLGNPLANVGATVTPMWVRAFTGLGQLAVTSGPAIALTGQEAASGLGALSVTTSSNADFAVQSLSAVAELGTVAAEVPGSAAVPVSLPARVMVLGTPTIDADVSLVEIPVSLPPVVAILGTVRATGSGWTDVEPDEYQWINVDKDYIIV